MKLSDNIARYVYGKENKEQHGEDEALDKLFSSIFKSHPKEFNFELIKNISFSLLVAICITAGLLKKEILITYEGLNQDSYLFMIPLIAIPIFVGACRFFSYINWNFDLKPELIQFAKLISGKDITLTKEKNIMIATYQDKKQSIQMNKGYKKTMVEFINFLKN